MSSFIRCTVWSGPQNVEMIHMTLTTPNWGIVRHHKTNTSRGPSSMQFEVSIAVAIAEVFQRVYKSKMSRDPETPTCGDS